MQDTALITENEQNEDVMHRVLRAYAKHSRDATLGDEIQTLIKASKRAFRERDAAARLGRLAEGRILAVIGQPGAGKTRALERIFHQREEFWKIANVEDRTLVSVKAPSPCTLRQLGNPLLKALGYPTLRDLKENVVWQMVRERLPIHGIRYVHIDELQHAVEYATAGELQKVRNTLKALLQQSEWPVCLILSGLPSLVEFIQGDRQLKRRTRFVTFADMSLTTDRDDIHAMARGLIIAAAKLSAPKIFNDAFYARLLHAAENQFGTMIEYVQDAIDEAFGEGVAEVTIDHFADVYEARSGCDPEFNVFTSAEWHKIDVAEALRISRGEETDDLKPIKKIREKKNR
ncbi:ATP-binding protein [Rhizobium sp. ZW T2_16]|uniref:ATP-binding protein n=1 Tax=Rhizobium sp. ZW T2_16 TaxID=3378083 RepID=UPI00385378F7